MVKVQPTEDGCTLSYQVVAGSCSVNGENAQKAKVIENNTGAVLPSTGGMGTTVFYVVGGGLMAVAVVLLVTKKRMENKR